MITMRTVMAEASTVTTTQRGPIVRRTRGRYQARPNLNNRKSRRHRRRRWSYFAAPIPREERKAAAKSDRSFLLYFSQILPLIHDRKCERSKRRDFRRIELQEKSRSLREKRFGERFYKGNIFR